MKIYTKTGDDGTTALFAGGRVKKDHARVETYGTVDELNSVLGVARAAGTDPGLDEVLSSLQHELFVVGADLATPFREGGDKPHVMRLPEGAEARLETLIDESEKELEPLKNFILPGGTLQSAHLHHARTVCRRAERLCVTLSAQDNISSGVVTYLNRLSDLLFTLGRLANARAGERDVEWNPKR